VRAAAIPHNSPRNSGATTTTTAGSGEAGKAGNAGDITESGRPAAVPLNSSVNSSSSNSSSIKPIPHCWPLAGVLLAEARAALGADLGQNWSKPRTHGSHLFRTACARIGMLGQYWDSPADGQTLLLKEAALLLQGPVIPPPADAVGGVPEGWPELGPQAPKLSLEVAALRTLDHACTSLGVLAELRELNSIKATGAKRSAGDGDGDNNSQAEREAQKQELTKRATEAFYSAAGASGARETYVDCLRALCGSLFTSSGLAEPSLMERSDNEGETDSTDPTAKLTTASAISHLALALGQILSQATRASENNPSSVKSASMQIKRLKVALKRVTHTPTALLAPDGPAHRSDLFTLAFGCCVLSRPLYMRLGPAGADTASPSKSMNRGVISASANRKGNVETSGTLESEPTDPSLWAALLQMDMLGVERHACALWLCALHSFAPLEAAPHTPAIRSQVTPNAAEAFAAQCRSCYEGLHTGSGAGGLRPLVNMLSAVSFMAHAELKEIQAEEVKVPDAAKKRVRAGHVEQRPVRTVSVHIQRQLLMALAAGGSALAQLLERGERHERDWRDMQEQVCSCSCLLITKYY